MEPVPQTSFIPRRPLTTQPPPAHRLRPLDLVIVAAVLLLIVSLGFYGGSVFFRYLLDRQINAPCEELSSSAGDGELRCGLRASVDREEKNLDRATILSLQRLDGKLKIAAELTRDHMTPLSLFSLLEELTLPTVAYTKFAYDGRALSLEGRATKFEDLAVQGDLFLANKRKVVGFSFSDLNLDQSGNVTFKLTLLVDPAVTSYFNYLQSRQAI